jgi:hypothetical protein
VTIDLVDGVDEKVATERCEQRSWTFDATGLLDLTWKKSLV